MKQEEKQLLLKDLCARYPYNAVVKEICAKYNNSADTKLILNHLEYIMYSGWEIKPYLRPISSMSQSEYDEYLCIKTHGKPFEVIDWLNAHHFDYRGLIEKGLALEAPEDMYNLK